MQRKLAEELITSKNKTQAEIQGDSAGLCAQGQSFVTDIGPIADVSLVGNRFCFIRPQGVISTGRREKEEVFRDFKHDLQEKILFLKD